MADRNDFEARLEARLQACAAVATRPFDATEIALKAIATGARRRGIGRIVLPSRPLPLAWLAVVLLLVIALLGAITFAGAFLRRGPTGASNGWLAFSEQDGIRDGDSEIFLAKEGVPERHLVGSAGYGVGIRAVCPSFSPDGTRLAYSEATVSPTPPVSGSTQQLPGHFDVSNRFIVVLSLDASGSPIGTAVRIPVNAGVVGVSCPTWSRDGRSIAYLASSPDNTSSTLWVADLIDGTSITATLPVGFVAGLAWSPDGTSVAGSAETGIWIVQPYERKVRQLQSAGTPNAVQPPNGPLVQFTESTWSPDWTRFAVAATTYADAPDGGRSATGSSVEVYRADGTGSPIELAGGNSLAWSPDGSRIAYVREPDPSGPNHFEIVSVAPETNDVRVVVNEVRTIRGLTWSPDGKRFAYVADDGTSGALVSVSTVGDPAPIVMTQQPHYLEFTDSNSLSWQPLFP